MYEITYRLGDLALAAEARDAEGALLLAQELGRQGREVLIRDEKGRLHRPELFRVPRKPADAALAPLEILIAVRNAPRSQP